MLSPLYLPALITWTSTGYIGLLFVIVWGPSRLRTKWYKDLLKPWFYPSDLIFGLIWFLMYNLMGIATFFIWQTNTIVIPGGSLNEVNNVGSGTYYWALGLYLAHLLPLATWGFLFYGLKWITGGLVAIVITWIAAVVTLVAFFLVNMTGAFIFLAYPIWLTYIVFLNGIIWWENVFKHNVYLKFSAAENDENYYGGNCTVKYLYKQKNSSTSESKHPAKKNKRVSYKTSSARNLENQNDELYDPDNLGE